MHFYSLTKYVFIGILSFTCILGASAQTYLLDIRGPSGSRVFTLDNDGNIWIKGTLHYPFINNQPIYLDPNKSYRSLKNSNGDVVWAVEIYDPSTGLETGDLYCSNHIVDQDIFSLKSDAINTFFYNGSLVAQVENDGTFDIIGTVTTGIPLVYGAAFDSQWVPYYMTKGISTSVVVGMRNTGTAPWYPEDDVRLGSQNPRDNTMWGLNRIDINNEDRVLPGDSYYFIYSILSPSTAGYYDFQWKMLIENVAWFGESSINKKIRVVDFDHGLALSSNSDNEWDYGWLRAAYDSYPAQTYGLPQFWDWYITAPNQQGLYPSNVTFSTDVIIPNSWVGKTITLDFGMVNYITDLYVNNNHIDPDSSDPMSHYGGYVPFNFDITNYVTPGSAASIRVDLYGGSVSPIVSSSGDIEWPVGWYGNMQGWGIIDEVWLKPHGKVMIKDVFIKTSTRNNSITIEYLLQNNDDIPHIVNLHSQAEKQNTGATELSLQTNNVSLSARELKSVIVTSTWSNPSLWYPDTPTLYNLLSTIIEGSSTVDQRIDKFGFREIYIDGDHYVLNGTRLNMRGENLPNFFQDFRGEQCARIEYMSYWTWPSTVDTFKDHNYRVIRFHLGPVPQYLIDVTDEKGLLVISEAPIASNPLIGRNLQTKQNYINNSKKWIKEWIVGNRNHPSIIMWNAENEMQMMRGFTDDDVEALGNEILLYDTTRPVNYDGDQPTGGEIANYHYPETGGHTGTIIPDAQNDGLPYSPTAGWTNLIDYNLGIPVGVGEFLTDYGDFRVQNKWWQIVWLRGLRYNGFDDIRPYTLSWVWKESRDVCWGGTFDPIESASRQFRLSLLKNSFAPIALFDIEYDNLGITPLKEKIYPTLHEGSFVSRNLVLYNDEFAGTSIEVNISIVSNGITYATGTLTTNLVLGDKKLLTCNFQTPYVGGGQMAMVLKTKKSGVERFSETKLFSIVENGSGASSSIVTISQ